MTAARQRTTMRNTPGAHGGSLVPWEEWETVWPRVNKLWDPQNTPHHSIIGLTGSGKSYLGINGILKPMCPMDRVLIIDSKRDDQLVSTVGKPIQAIPKTTWANTRRREPFDQWFRLEVVQGFGPAKRREKQEQVHRALERVYGDGQWVVFMDEIRDLTDPKPPNLGLAPWVDEIYRKGRSKGISIIACTQAPRWVPASFYDQASFAWIGRLADEQKQKRLLEIGGMGKQYFGDIAGLQRRQWLLSADNGEHLARTMVKIKDD